MQQFLRSELARYYRYGTIDAGRSVSQISLGNSDSLRSEKNWPRDTKKEKKPSIFARGTTDQGADETNGR